MEAGFAPRHEHQQLSSAALVIDAATAPSLGDPLPSHVKRSD